MNRELSFEQRIHNALAVQTVEEYKARHAYLHGVGYSREEWDLMWHRSENCTWAHQFGRMVGWDEVYFNNVEHMDHMMALGSFAAMEKYHELAGHDLRSVTSGGCHALCSDVIEVADDGMSARSYYLTPGTLMGSVGFDGETRSGVWLWERYGSDFVYVDGEWKWFHEQVCPDLAGNYDIGNWGHDRYMQYLDGSISIGDVGGRPALLTEPGLFHADYNIVQTVQNTVPPPKPYRTLDDDNTYSPGRNDPYDNIVIEVERPTEMDMTAITSDYNPFEGMKARDD